MITIQIADEHTLSEVLDLLAERGWADGFELDRGDVYIAWDEALIGCLQKIDVAERTAVLDLVLVNKKRRREGIGTKLVSAAAEGVEKGYVSCREDAVAFYQSLGFTALAGGIDAAPLSAQEYWRESGNRAPLALARTTKRAISRKPLPRVGSFFTGTPVAPRGPRSSACGRCELRHRPPGQW